MKVVLFVLLLGLIGQAQSGRPAPTKELVGLKGIGVGSADLIWGFDIDLAEGRIVAVCNVPDGWKITAENFGEAALDKNGGGNIKGEADFGHDAEAGTVLKNLGSFILLDVSTIHRKSATLSGSVTIMRPQDDRKFELRAENFDRQAANQCR